MTEIKPSFKPVRTSPHFRLKFVSELLTRLLVEEKTPLDVHIRAIIRYINEHEGEDRDEGIDEIVDALRPSATRLAWEQNLNAD